MLLRSTQLGKASFAAFALIVAAVGTYSVKPRELYHEMYPLEPVKQDAFRICDETDPTFVRAVGVEREACYDRMPHVMAVAMGRIKPVAVGLLAQALADPAREAELLMALAVMPPQQPITTPRSFSDTAWVRALTPPCAEARVQPIVATAASGASSPTGAGRADSLDGAIGKNLPPLPRGAQPTGPQHSQLPPMTLTPGRPASATVVGDKDGAVVSPLPAPDIGDQAAPAIIPLAPTNNCGGA
jgi:hypothetical protein